MKRLYRSVWLAMVMLLSVVSVVHAYNQPPIKDAFSDTVGNPINTTRLNVQSSFSGVGCNPQLTTYLQWDLSSISDSATVGTANLSLTVESQTFGSGTANLRLYRVDDDSWTETDPPLQPTLGASLATIYLSTAPVVGSTLTFPSTTALRNFIADQITGDNLASFAVQLTECTIGAPVVRFHSRESTTGAPPSLELLGPNSITLNDFSSDNPSISPVILAVAALLLGAVVALAVVRRRRTAN